MKITTDQALSSLREIVDICDADRSAISPHVVIIKQFIEQYETKTNNDDHDIGCRCRRCE